MEENTQKVERKSRTQYNFSRAQFVEAWQTSNSVQEAADKLTKLVGTEVPKSIVAARKASYKKLGANFKDMPRTRDKRVDITAINNQIVELSKQS
jgi:hypothetical protein